MGLSSLPAPSEGVLCVLLVNTALSLSIFKGLVRTILHIVGIRLSSSSPQPPSSSSSSSSQPSDYIEARPEAFELCRGPSYAYIEEFRSRIPTIQFQDVMCNFHNGEDDSNEKQAEHEHEHEHECSVCLSQFEPESEINHLSCGHLFHKDCLEKWLDYWNITCPLCRTPLMPEEEISCFW